MSIPFQATHTADDGRYYMVDECEWFYANHMGHWKRHWSGAPAGLKVINQQKKQWSGPEDGLPPVGTVCEHSADYNEGDSHDGEWFKVEVVAHHRFQEDDYVCAIWVRDAQISYSSAGDHFRALKTPDQQAADKRETAIRELMDIAQVDCRVTAARLVDAGFKR